MVEFGSTFFRLIEEGLAEYRPRLRIGKANPSVVNSNQFCDYIFEGKQAGVSIMVDPSCTNMIRELTILKTAPDGTKHRQMKTDPKTKMRYQELGHYSDSLIYGLVTSYALHYEVFKGGGKPWIPPTAGKMFFRR